MNNELNIGTINGLTVENILDKMVEKGIGTYIGYAGPGTGGTVDGTISLGNTVIFDTKEWIVCHVDNTLHCAYLASKHLYGNTTFGNGGTYDGSNLAAKALEFELTMSEGAKLRMVGTRVNNVTGKIFIASYEQMNGGFSYFNSNSRRACDDSRYWTSSLERSGFMWCVESGGYLSSNHTYSASSGFRPFCCISI